MSTECRTCQIREYTARHYGTQLSWENCPYVCEYAIKMRYEAWLKEKEAEHAVAN